MPRAFTPNSAFLSITDCARSSLVKLKRANSLKNNQHSQLLYLSEMLFGLLEKSKALHQILQQ